MTTAPLEKPTSPQHGNGNPPSKFDQLYEVVAANFPSTAAVVFDRDLRFILVDGAAVAEVGLNKQAMEGKTLYESLPPETVAQVESLFKGALNGQRSEYHAYLGTHFFAVTYSPLVDEEHNIYGGLCTYVDISVSKRAEELAARRLREMELVAEVSATASSLLNLDEMLKSVSELTKDRFKFYHAHMYVLNDTRDTLVLAAGAGEPGRIMLRRGHRIMVTTERSIVARAARTQQSAKVDDVLATPDYLPNPLLPETRSEIALPMIAGGVLLGVLDIQDNTIARFDQEDVRVLTALANQIAIAVQNARRFEQVRLYQDIAQNMTSGLNVYRLEKPGDPTSLRMTIANPKSAELIGIPNEQIIGKKIGDAFPTLIDTETPGIYARVAESGTNWESENILYSEPGVLSSAFSVKAFGLPNAHVGIMFDDIAPRLTLEVDAEKVRKRNEVLANVSSKLSQAANEEDIAKAIYDLEEFSPGLSLTSLSYINNDKSGEPYEVVTAAIIDGQGNSIPLSMLPITRFTTDDVPLLAMAYSSPNEVLFTDDVQQDVSSNETAITYLSAMGVKSMVTFPLRAANTWTGLVSMMWTELHTFSDDERELFQNILPALAAVVSSRRQYLATLEAERAAQNLNQNLQIVSEINARISNILDLDEMLTTASELIKTRFNRYHAQVYLLNPTNDVLQLAAGAGQAGKAMKARKHSIPVARENSLVARAARTREGVIENDVSSAPDFLPNPLLSGTQSEIAIPLIVTETLIGVLDIQADEINAFSEADISFTMALASQLAASIQNIRDVDEIRRSRQAVARIYDLSVDLVGTATHEGYLKDINSSWSRILGWTDEELRSKPFVAFVHPDDVQPTLDEYARQIGLGSPSISFDNRYMCKDGSFRWFSWNAVPVAAEGLTYFVTRDVTDRVEYERAIERRARELETVAQVSAAITTVFDRDELLQKVADLTKSAFNLYHAHVYLLTDDGQQLLLAAGAGIPGKIMKGRGHAIAVSHPHSLVARAARTKQVVIENDVSSTSDFLPNPLLPETRSEMAVPLVIGERILGVLDVQSDVLRSFREENAKILSTLAAQIAVAVENTNVVQRVLLTERAVENSTSGLSIRDMTKPGMPLIYVNPAYEQMMGTDTKDTLSENWEFVSVEDNDPAVLAEMQTAISEGRQTAVVLLTKRQDGTLFYDEMRLSPILTARGQLTHYVAVHTDISERLEVERQREETLHAAEETAERLREVDRLKSQFLANMSHELRTPLNSIIGYSEILLDGDDGELSEEAVEDVETIHNSGHHLLSLINDVLDLAKIEAGEMRLDRVSCSVAKIAEDVLHAAEVLNKKPIDLKVEIVGDPINALADPIRVRQILMNLVSNAIKFTEKGSVTVQIEPKNGRLSVSVKDTGMGIPEAYLGIVFDQFRQVDGSSTRRAGGTGLGLTITRHLVHMHQGEIEVESQVGAGSTFRFSLPIAEAAPA